MTNYEKHRVIDSLWRQGFNIGLNKDTDEIFPCSELDCEECAFSSQFVMNGGTCNVSQPKWLVAEYQEVDWSKVPIDTPILVRDYNDTLWHRRYFAGLDERGKVTAWSNGCTSWTNEEEDAINWAYAKLAEVDND